MAAQDYGAMLDHFWLMERRHGLVRRVVQLPMHPRSDDEIVQVYADAITPRTRLLMICHLVNITGQVLPVRKVTEMAHARGVQVMKDGIGTKGPTRSPTSTSVSPTSAPTTTAPAFTSGSVRR